MQQLPKYKAWIKKWRIMAVVNSIDFNAGAGIVNLTYVRNGEKRTGYFDFFALILLPCIGLPDKHGKLIYAGDLIVHPRYSRPHSSKKIRKLVKCRVQWNTGKSSSDTELNPQMKEDKSLFNHEPSFTAEPVDYDLPESRWGYNWSVFHSCEIIGNIYEQPYLNQKRSIMLHVKETDKFFYDSPDAGDKKCICSRCSRHIPEEEAPVIRVFPTEEGDHGWDANAEGGTEFRYCIHCCKAMGMEFFNSRDEYENDLP